MAKSKLKVQWYVEKDDRKIGGVLDQVRWKIERRERKRREQEMKGESVEK